ncbi:MAG: hypothetical protein IH994_06035 [Proteobacteria bacterium]|nr:hypothetical protein [Pseudomonadota bacterium]
MNEIYPLVFVFDGEAMVPVNGRSADRQYVVGESYRLAPFEERSTNSHNHFFACVNEAWLNLPIEQSGLFASAKHFRKWLLIKTGYRHERTIVAANRDEARKLAVFAESVDPFSLVQVKDSVVTIWTAESQSMRAMKKKRFQASKDDVLNEAAAMIGVTSSKLKDNAGLAA